MVTTQRRPQSKKNQESATKTDNPFEESATAQATTDADAEHKPFSRARNNWEKVPGNALLRAIREELLARGENTDDMVIEGLGLTRSGWNNIINGSRDIRTLAERPGQLMWLSNFLGLPPVAVRVMAGEMQIEELTVNVSLDDRLRLTAEALRKDPVWAVYAPHNIEKEWDTLPLKIRMLIKALYDSECNRTYTWAVEETGKPGGAAGKATKGKKPPIEYF